MVDPDKPTKCKVGITKDPSQRIKAYKTAAPQCYFLEVYQDIETYHEKRILSILKEISKVQSEYVHLNPKIVQNIVESYFVDEGVL
jgi:hypothetical protein